MNWLHCFFVRYFELARGGQAANLRPMEGMRGFAVFLVFQVHYATLVSPWLVNAGAAEAIFSGLHGIGNAGVDLFFVLSGYLIYATLIESSRPFGGYLARRVLRIYPTFLVVFAVYLVLTQLQPEAQRKVPHQALEATVYIAQNLLLLPGIFTIEPLISVAWSLSYEMFYYLLMPLLIGVFGLRGCTRAWRMGFFCVLGLLAFSAAAVWGGPVRLTLFLAGVLLYELLAQGRWLAPRASVAALALLGCLAALLIPMPGPAGQALRSAVLCTGFFVLCWNCFAQPQGGLARLFSVTPLRWLGNMSYSYYLVHGLSLQVFFLVVGKLLGPTRSDALAVLMMAPAFLFTLLPSAMLFLCIERPLSLVPALSRRPADKVKPLTWLRTKPRQGEANEA